MTRYAEAQESRADLDRAAKIIMEVCEETQIAYREMVGPFRDRRIAHPRQFSMWRMAHETALSQARIGKLHGGRSPWTVQHAVKAVEKRLAQNAATK